MNFSALLEQKIEEHKTQREALEVKISQRMEHQRNNLNVLLDEIRGPLEELGYYVKLHSGSMNYSRMWKDASDELEANQQRWQDHPLLHGCWIDIHIGRDSLFQLAPEHRAVRPWGRHGHAQTWSCKSTKLGAKYKPASGKHDAFIKIAWFEDETGGCDHRWVISPNVCYMDNERVSIVNPLVYRNTRHDHMSTALKYLSDIVAEVVNYESHLKDELGVK